jgi:hypothetical protein
MELFSEDARSLHRIIKMLKEALTAPHMTGVTRQREDKRRQAAARHLAEVRAILVDAIASMENEEIDELSVVYQTPRIPNIRPRIRRRGKQSRMEQFADE